MRPRLRDLFWYLPHETYLVTLKAEPSITLGDYVRTVLPALDPGRRAASDPPADAGPGPPAPHAPRAVALGPRPEGRRTS